jgi:enoyl-CoA hydratase/carnithine racemase
MIIGYSVRDHVAHLTLDAPPVNALTIPLLDALLSALRRASEDPDVRAVVVESAVPRFFCAGLDLAVLADRSEAEIHAVVERLYTELTGMMFDLGKPVIAAVSGAARGGGMTIAISCNVILAGESATFGYPEIDAGLIPAIHFTHLPAVVGRHRAFELLFTGRVFSAAEAKDLGLISRVVADADLAEEAHRLALVFAGKSPSVVKAARAAFMEANDHGYRAGVAKAVETFTAVAVSEDGREGVRAFVEKRKPHWTLDSGQ